MNHEKFYFDHNTGFWHPIDFELSHCEKCGDVHETKYIERGVCEDVYRQLRNDRGGDINSDWVVRLANFTSIWLSLGILLAGGLGGIIYTLISTGSASDPSMILLFVGIMFVSMIIQAVGTKVRLRRASHLEKQFDNEHPELTNMEEKLA